MYDSLINVNGNQVPTLEILLLLTIVALLPSLIIMMTSFPGRSLSCHFCEMRLESNRLRPIRCWSGFPCF